MACCMKNHGSRWHETSCHDFTPSTRRVASTCHAAAVQTPVLRGYMLSTPSVASRSIIVVLTGAVQTAVRDFARLLHMSQSGGQCHRYDGNCCSRGQGWHTADIPLLLLISSMRTKTISLTRLHFMHTMHRPTNQDGANFMLKAFNRWHSTIEHMPNNSTHT